MKTLVIFRLSDGSYLSGSLERLAEFPRAGHSYLFNKRMYDVLQVVEPLGSSGGNSQLLELIGLDQKDELGAAGAMASMISLDPAPKKASLAEEPDRVVLVRLQARKGKKTVRLGDLSLDSAQLLDQPAEPSRKRRRRRRRSGK